MFWIRSGLHSISISDWLTAGPAVAADPAALDEARRALQEALGEAGSKKRPTLALKIRHAPDARGLWELRADVMTVVSQLYGEAEGRRRLARATPAFASLLPQARSLTSGKRKHAMQRTS
ncbi:hypothetical protein [Ramlibacter sp. PS4R-6]|uniref:hypothetical protein n=1 Tax=Ramlibacter sp. PS4R-6 TaxID=3133438 RepID=UPI0030AB5495